MSFKYVVDVLKKFGRRAALPTDAQSCTQRECADNGGQCPPYAMQAIINLHCRITAFFTPVLQSPTAPSFQCAQAAYSSMECTDSFAHLPPETLL